MVITETKLAIEVQPRIVAEKPLEVERRRFYVLSANDEAHGHVGRCPGYALLTSHGKARKTRKDEFREQVGTIIERTLAGEARMETHEDRIAETARVREKRRARIERGAGMCLWQPGTEMTSRWRFDMRTHLAVTSKKTSTKRKE